MSTTEPEIWVDVHFGCPACGAEGYEENFTYLELKAATQLVLECEDCEAKIAVDVDLRMQVKEKGVERWTTV